MSSLLTTLTPPDSLPVAGRVSTTATGSARCSLLADCERQLLSDCAVVPLFSQQKRLLIASGIQGLVFDPFGPVLDLTETTLKK